MTGLNDVGGIDKIFRNGATRNKPCLVRVDQIGEKGAQSDSEAFGDDFEAKVLKGNGSEVVRPVSTRFFGEEDDVRLIDGAKVTIQ